MPARAGEILDINFFGYDPLFEKANFVPGESINRLVEVKNKTNEIQSIAVKVKENFDDGLGAQIEMRIIKNSVERYKAVVSDFFNIGEVYLSDLAPNTTTQYNFIASFYETAKNNFQGSNLGFDIIIGSQTGESIGGENGSSGGGYQFRNLIIFNEGVVVNNARATISWVTNQPATSRVIYDTISHPDISQSNPRDEKIECHIIVNNNSDFPAYDVNLNGTLTKGLFYNNTKDETKNWNIGNINGNEFKSISYMIDIDSKAKEGIYNNFVNLYASNHNFLDSSTDVSVQKIKVLSMESIRSGFSSKEFLLLLSILIILIILNFFVKKKIKK